MSNEDTYFSRIGERVSRASTVQSPILPTEHFKIDQSQQEREIEPIKKEARRGEVTKTMATDLRPDDFVNANPNQLSTTDGIDEIASPLNGHDHLQPPDDDPMEVMGDIAQPQREDPPVPPISIEPPTEEDREIESSDSSYEQDEHDQFLPPLEEFTMQQEEADLLPTEVVEDPPRDEQKLIAEDHIAGFERYIEELNREQDDMVPPEPQIEPREVEPPAPAPETRSAPPASVSVPQLSIGEIRVEIERSPQSKVTRHRSRARRSAPKRAASRHRFHGLGPL